MADIYLGYGEPPAIDLPSGVTIDRLNAVKAAIVAAMEIGTTTVWRTGEVVQREPSLCATDDDLSTCSIDGAIDLDRVALAAIAAAQ